MSLMIAKTERDLGQRQLLLRHDLRRRPDAQRPRHAEKLEAMGAAPLPLMLPVAGVAAEEALLAVVESDGVARRDAGIEDVIELVLQIIECHQAALGLAPLANRHEDHERVHATVPTLGSAYHGGILAGEQLPEELPLRVRIAEVGAGQVVALVFYAGPVLGAPGLDPEQRQAADLLV